jgi:hypothetical protein
MQDVSRQAALAVHRLRLLASGARQDDVAVLQRAMPGLSSRESVDERKRQQKDCWNPGEDEAYQNAKPKVS